MHAHVHALAYVRVLAHFPARGLEQVSVRKLEL